MSVLEQQIALYGEPLGTRFGRVMQAYDLSQRRLAATLGLSAPMLSQLISGKRTKIGNPAVYERLVLLEQRSSEADPVRVLAEVEATLVNHSTTQLRAMTQRGHAHLAQDLAVAVPRAELRAALEQVASSAPVLHQILQQALAHDPTGP